MLPYLACLAAALSMTPIKPNPQSPSGNVVYNDQMQVVSACTSQGVEHEPKDAQETSEDAQLLRRFRIVQLIGTGNYARVYKALSSQNKEYAVKTINLSKTTDNYKQKFLPRELNIMRKLSHANIVKLHEIMQIADRVFIIMQFCHKGTVADLLQRAGPLSEPVARHFFAGMVDAVLYMHSNEIAHRDLKLENVLLDQEYNPKITDFSYSVSTFDKSTNPRVARDNLNKLYPAKNNNPAPRHSSLRLNDTFCGTLPYLSPEMMRQYPYDSKKSDVWSLGVCLFVMLNDRLPFPFNDIKVMVRKQLTRDYKFKASVDFSEPLKEIIAQMLEPDYLKRLNITQVSRHTWLANGPRERPSA